MRSEDLELALLRFTSKRRALSAEIPPRDRPDLASSSNGASTLGAGVRARAEIAGAWPRPMEIAWDAVLRDLEAGLLQPLGSVSRRVLIQARVTLEVERDLTEAKYGKAPSMVADRIRRLFAAVSAHMRSSAPLAEERPRHVRDMKLSWPVSPVIVTSPFGYRRDPILGRKSVRFHAGVDLGGETGDVVHSAGAGRVVGAGWLGGHGRTVIVQHAGGYQTVYAHLRQIITSLGAAVDPGSAIGFVGTSGRSTGPHLHFEVRRGGIPIDPLDAIDFAFESADSSVEKDGPQPLARAR